MATATIGESLRTGPWAGVRVALGGSGSTATAGNFEIFSVEDLSTRGTKRVDFRLEAIIKGELDKIGEILDYGWHNKKLLAPGITNPMIDELYKTAIDNGASGGKISGAGGGGFIIFYCPNNSRHKVIEALSTHGGVAHPYEFTVTGLKSWSV